MNSNFNKLYIDGLWTQWAFHRVQEHPKRSSLLSSILILIYLPFTCSLFIYVFTIHYYVFYYSLLRILYYVFIITYLLLRIYYSFTYLIFISLCTMHYALYIIYYALYTMHYLLFIRIHYFIRIHMYSLFHVTKSRNFGTYA